MKLFRKKTIESILKTQEKEPTHQLNKVLGVRDLTFLGVAAIIGAGSFSSMGEACYKGGPGVIILFIFCAIACGFAALCYAEFASRIPISGSAYTYAYASFGELFAWVIGWALLMEYSIGNIYVAFAWSDYFTALLEGLNIHLPAYVTCSYMDAKKCVAEGKINEGLLAWNSAPKLAGIRLIADCPAFIINIFITILVYVGVKESRNASNIMVILKLLVVALVIVVGVFYINTDNWQPFMPNGFGGVMGGVAAVFFAFIGFDAVSTMAEECKNPQRDLPRGMLYSLIICTIAYIMLSLVLTGMVKYNLLGVGDPLAEVFKLRGVNWMLYIVAICAVVAMTSVLLVFQMGQPRIWLSMSRDGLLPERFSKIHPTYQTPSFSTIITGLVVGVPLLFTDKKFVLDFTSIATLFAFVLVCGGVLLLPRIPKNNNSGFQLPYINSKIILPIFFVTTLLLIALMQPTFFNKLFQWQGEQGFSNFSLFIFFIIYALFSILSYRYNYSLIPILGVLTCTYLLTGMSISNWLWFIAWLALGLIIYFSYSYKKSKLNV